MYTTSKRPVSTSNISPASSSVPPSTCLRRSRSPHHSWGLLVASLLCAACTGDEPGNPTQDAITLDCNSITSPLTLEDVTDEGVDYLVTCPIRVEAALTLKPGVVIAFEEEKAGFTVQAQGSLNATGTAQAPIVLTSLKETPGAWQGLKVITSSTDNHLEHVDVLYAGAPSGVEGTGQAALLLSGSNARMTVKHATIAHSASHGIELFGARHLTLEQSTITNNMAHPLAMDSTSLHVLDPESHLEGNVKDSVLVTSQTVSSGTYDWHAANVPVFLERGLRFSGADVTLHEGLTLMFGADTGLEVSEASSLATQGSLDAPVVFTGELEEKGAWKGIEVRSNSVKNRLDYAHVLYAGGGAFNSNNDTGGIIMTSGSTLVLSNSRLAHSASHGLNINYTISNFTFEHNTITDCEREPVRIPIANIHQLDEASILTGNAHDAVLVQTNRMEASNVQGTWHNLSVPYYFGANVAFTLKEESAITIAPGSELRFAANAGIQVRSDSSLTLEGTPEARIQLLGEDEVSQAWRGLMYYSKSPKNRLSHVTLKHAGSDSFNSNGDKGGLIIYADAQVTLEDVEITESGACAVSAEYNSSELIDAGMNMLSGDVAGVCLP